MFFKSSTYSYWGGVNWFVRFIVLIYLVSPIFYWILKRKPKLFYISIILAIPMICWIFWNHDYYAKHLLRIIDFAVGMIIAQQYETKATSWYKKSYTYCTMLLGGIILLGLTWEIHMGATITRIPMLLCYIAITPGMCVLLTEIFCRLPEKINDFLGSIGSATFEILLWHVLVMENILATVMIESRIQAMSIYIISIAIGFTYKRILDMTMTALSHNNAKR